MKIRRPLLVGKEKELGYIHGIEKSGDLKLFRRLS
jgi:hypothetical protein